MLVTSVESFGFGGVMDRIRGHKKRMSPANRSRAALRGAEVAMSLVTVDMARAKSGTWWHNLKRPSSASGEAPAIQSADLVNSFEAHIIGPGTAAWDATAPHAQWLEFGWVQYNAPGSFYIRPFMRPGVAKHRRAIKSAMKAEMMGI